eukprot:13785223-Heterocapsa_arctica.AAC.1
MAEEGGISPSVVEAGRRDVRRWLWAGAMGPPSASGSGAAAAGAVLGLAGVWAEMGGNHSCAPRRVVRGDRWSSPELAARGGRGAGTNVGMSGS